MDRQFSRHTCERTTYEAQLTQVEEAAARDSICIVSHQQLTVKDVTKVTYPSQRRDQKTVVKA